MLLSRIDSFRLVNPDDAGWRSLFASMRSTPFLDAPQVRHVARSI